MQAGLEDYMSKDVSLFLEEVILSDVSLFLEGVFETQNLSVDQSSSVTRGILLCDFVANNW